MPYPIQFESRRRSLPRFLKLSCLDIETLWFPLVPELIKVKFAKAQSLKLTIARTLRARQKCFCNKSDLAQASYSIILATVG
ncbi:transposase [Microseira wollei NIES-4236]|uniref:Transposase n=1 Tax=Microseira wollei NIES-4236 TaxID=2530354 RepID=A0AAV3XQG2_9CYAN|nr:transposase [Microseira wollei NIES-4236]